MLRTEIRYFVSTDYSIPLLHTLVWLVVVMQVVPKQWLAIARNNCGSSRVSEMPYAPRFGYQLYIYRAPKSQTVFRL